MRAKCYCDIRFTSVDNASWVEELNGVSRPFCTTECHRRWLQKVADGTELNDRMPSEIYAKNNDSFVYTAERRRA